MSCCFRVILLICLMLLSACATCAILFPTYRLYGTETTFGKPKNTVYYWYRETSSPLANNEWSISRVYTRDYSCKEDENYSLASAALSVGGAGLGGLACMFMACWVLAGHRAALGIVSCILTFFAFACCTVVVGLTSFLYVNVPCKKDNPTAKTYKDQDYKLVEGFILMAVAAGGFLIFFVVQLIGFCCYFCCGTNYDDNLSDDYERHQSKRSRASGSSYSRTDSDRSSRSQSRGTSRNSSYRN